jgi:hypothetical protein
MDRRSPTPAPPHPVQDIQAIPAGPSPSLILQRPLAVPEPYFTLSEDPTRHRSWPHAWQKLFEYAKTFALCDIMFNHGFPTPRNMDKQAGEALSLAWQAFIRTVTHVLLNQRVCKSLALPSTYNTRP